MSFWKPSRPSSVADDLRSVPLFADCTDRELEHVSTLTTAVSVEAGRVLLAEGGTRRQFLVVADGTVSVSHADEAIAVLGTGDFVGELSLLGSTRPNATVTTLTPTTLWVSSSAEFRSLLDAAPSARAKVAAAAAERLAAAS
ncbi:cyclic nucleotide-binding domain-containing protein [Aquihabitans sp. G128]|uniref:cyclic nucleotide-binding domain-containing protein n=1 Tax=Aquihabitans sp. G128 TaxID=2849779 RepID=UPI001C2446E5|nr:cyclic nucleotide-binding domain-containing protein [Aquihabitans sp. G128]QXC61106.1 cyclic nucleotide-binding domain-containing protein [Aquihabitans sp. G128]